MALDAAESWRNLFENWPNIIPKQGIVVTTVGENIPFVNFLYSGTQVLLERDKPDSQNARKVILAYSAIAAVKLPSPMELARFTVMGFQAT